MDDTFTLIVFIVIYIVGFVLTVYFDAKWGGDPLRRAELAICWFIFVPILAIISGFSWIIKTISDFATRGRK